MWAASETTSLVHWFVYRGAFQMLLDHRSWTKFAGFQREKWWWRLPDISGIHPLEVGSLSHYVPSIFSFVWLKICNAYKTTKPVDTGNINRIVGFATIWDADGMLYFPTPTNRVDFNGFQIWSNYPSDSLSLIFRCYPSLDPSILNGWNLLHSSFAILFLSR